MTLRTKLVVVALVVAFAGALLLMVHVSRRAWTAADAQSDRPVQDASAGRENVGRPASGG